MNAAEYEALMNDEYVPGYTGRQVRDAKCIFCGGKANRKDKAGWSK